MNKTIDWVTIGRFGRTHGIRGDIIVHSFTEPTDNIMQYTQWYASINKHWQPIKLTRIANTVKHILVQVDGYETQEQVSALTNVDIAIPRDNLAALPAGEYYWHELIGMQVINMAGESFGCVDDIMATGSNDVLVVQGEKRHLIPYLVNQFIVKIDPDKQLITVNWDIDF